MERADPELYGLLGVFLIAAGMVVSAGTFHGMYAPWNHFVSELGNYQKSTGAAVYNLCLIAGGSALVIPARRIRRLSGFASTSLLCAIICLVLSGFLSENVLVPHVILAFILFTFLGMSVFLVGVAVFNDVHLPCRWRVLASSVLAIAVAFLFLISPKDRLLDIIRGAPTGKRPEFWCLATMEWSFVISVFIWVMALSAFLRDQQESDNHRM